MVFRLARSVLLAATLCMTAQAWAEDFTVLYRFQGGSDGARPSGGLVEAGGKLFGTTAIGGPADQGTIFSIDPASGAERVVYSFAGALDGFEPAGGLIFDDGKLYGATLQGGSFPAAQQCAPHFGCGVVFSLDVKTGAETILHRFTGGKDGGLPSGKLLLSDGNLYGLTSVGGISTGCVGQGCGTLYKVGTDGTAFGVLHRFGAGKGGLEPSGDLVLQDGLLMGAAAYGGAHGGGEVFAVDKDRGGERIVFSFGDRQSGTMPRTGLSRIGQALYGTTYFEGSTKKPKLGTAVFQVLAGSVQPVTTFGTEDGGLVSGGLASPRARPGAAARAYGTASFGGTADAGTVFAVDLVTGTTSVLHDFAGGRQGASPIGGVTFHGKRLFGVSQFGGITGSQFCRGGAGSQAGCGTVFALTRR